jgi:translation initiation factor 6 (eIF-6)
MLGLAVLLGVGVLFALIMTTSVVGTLNSEVDLRVLLNNKQKDNENEFDNKWKKINMVVQVPEAQKAALKDIIIGNAQARAMGNGANLELHSFLYRFAGDTRHTVCCFSRERRCH